MKSRQLLRYCYWIFLGLLAIGWQGMRVAEAPRTPLHVSVDMQVGEEKQITLRNGRTVQLRVISLDEEQDTITRAVRKAEVIVSVDGETVTLVSANYNLPVTVGAVQIDCPITRGYYSDTSRESWALEKDVRLRLWPAGSPWIQPGTFMYPAHQRWFATQTQMANEPTFVDGGEYPRDDIYYHNGLDIGGAEGLTEIVAATDGLVVSSGDHVLEGYEDSPARPRHDVVYVLDDRGWYYRYSHLWAIATIVTPGARVEMGDKIGMLGKEGGSGGWSHLHFDISDRQPSEKWGTEEGYAFLWQSYIDQYKPDVIAVARPHHFVQVGEEVVLDGSKSWSAHGGLERFDWEFTNGEQAATAIVKRAYDKPGTYSEKLKVTDSRGNFDYEFAVVQVVDRSLDPARQSAPGIHAVFYPTQNIQPGDPVTFLTRTFNTPEGNEVWNFGDGSSEVTVHCMPTIGSYFKKLFGGNLENRGDVHDVNGYVKTIHRFEKPGDYIVRVTHQDPRGYTVIDQVHVPVGVKE
jgi:hypothetical protein